MINWFTFRLAIRLWRCTQLELESYPRLQQLGPADPAGPAGKFLFNFYLKLNILFEIYRLKFEKEIIKILKNFRSPVFMVAASMSQNLMRVARTTAQTVTLTSGEYLTKLDLFLITLHCSNSKWWQQPKLIFEIFYLLFPIFFLQKRFWKGDGH